MLFKKMNPIRSLLIVVSALLLAFSAGPASAVGERWGAVAFVTWNDEQGGAHVRVGSAVSYPTEYEAESAARAQCEQINDGHPCVARAWNTGCGYITIGTADKRLGYFISATKEEVERLCHDGGFTECRVPQGGCLP